VGALATALPERGHRAVRKDRQLRLLETATPLQRTVDPPLLERTLELTALEDGVRRLAVGQGSVILVEAPAGLGKTALLEHAASEAADAGCLVRRAAPTRSERDFPYGVVRTLLEAPLRAARGAQRAAMLEGAAGPAATLLLGGASSDLESTADVALAHSILWLSAGIAGGRGLALIVDDAQWSDVPSLEALAYLARRIEDVPVLLVLASRPGAISAGSWGAATMLRPAPLAEGTPWLLVVLAHQLRHDPSCRRIAPAVRDLVRRRLGELTPVQRAAAATLSVLHPEERPAPGATDPGDTLASSGLTDPAAGRLAHPVIAAAIREELPPAELAAARAQRTLLETERGTASATSCAALALEALDGGGRLLDAAAHHRCIRVLIVADAVEDARRAINTLPDRASDCAAWHASELALRIGDVAAAERYARQALELTGGEPAALVGSLRVLVCALAERGAFDEAHDLLRGAGSPSAGLLLARARLHLAEGEYEQAYADAGAAGARRERQGRTNPTWDGWRSTAALALAHLGRRQEAAALSETELSLARAFAAPVPIARALAARAVAEPDELARVMVCENALDELGDRPATLETIRLRLELGSALARIGRRVEARDALRPALADADRAGALLLAQRARRELVATGLRPRRAALEGPGALTPRQRQICDLAAAGKANRAIATELFLSIKTVETHLAAAYRKLGVSTRSQLAVSLTTT